MFFNNPALAKEMAVKFSSLQPWWLEHFNYDFNTFCKACMESKMIQLEIEEGKSYQGVLEW